MKLKILLIFMAFFMLVNLVGCTESKVSLDQIEQDLQTVVSGENLTVDDVTVNLLKNEELRNVVHITTNLKSSEAIITRMYVMIYDYFEVGGWVLKECNPTKEDQWIAHLDEVTLTDEIVSDAIFVNAYNKGGYWLRREAAHDESVEIFLNSQFRWWTGGSISESPKTNHLEYFEIIWHDENNSQATVVANCRAFSDVLEIKEILEMEFLYDPISLNWIVTSGQSISNSYEFLVDLTGNYYDPENPYDHVFVESVDGTLHFSHSHRCETSWCYGNDFLDRPIRVRGLFDLSIGSDEDAVLSWSRDIGIENDPIRLNIEDSGIYYKQ